MGPGRVRPAGWGDVHGGAGESGRGGHDAHQGQRRPRLGCGIQIRTIHHPPGGGGGGGGGGGCSKPWFTSIHLDAVLNALCARQQQHCSGSGLPKVCALQVGVPPAERTLGRAALQESLLQPLYLLKQVLAGVPRAPVF